MEAKELKQSARAAKIYRRGSDSLYSPGKDTNFQRTDTPTKTIDPAYPDLMFTGQYIKSPIIESPLERSPMKKSPYKYGPVEKSAGFYKLFDDKAQEFPSFPDMSSACMLAEQLDLD